MSLQEYRSKRDLSESQEPLGKISRQKKSLLSFVVQKHAATHLHYDFRLEMGGVLKSWAIPKGPSMDPSIKRLAIQVEDHPLDYQHFEGTIPPGHYGAGRVEIWDKGTYTSLDKSHSPDEEASLLKQWEKGNLKFILAGEKLKGLFSLVKLKKDAKSWLLIKHRDSTAISASQGIITNPDKVYWPEEGYIKGDLLDYYQKISKFILPHLKDRPQVLHRFPNGVTGKSFYQKEAPDNLPPGIQTTVVQHEDRAIPYVLIQDVKSLLYVANLGCIEIHPFLNRYPHPDKPDYLVIDLDPENISFNHVIETAQTLHELLERVAISSFCKTSGATGLHIYIPLHAKYSYDQAHDFAQLLAHLTHRLLPGVTALERSPSKRQGKVYVDYLQNRLGQTVVAPYSVRPRAKAPVSTPLLWEEVKEGLDPQAFTIETIFTRLERLGDIFKPVLSKGINLSKSLKNLEQLG
jgi:DNA ligase D-like protein (predicted polymerase)/DNA ligase D-like protein (predicted 3'-phosphoesterase)